MNEADKKIAEYILSCWRSDMPHSDSAKRRYGEDTVHLSQCDANVRVEWPEATNSWCGEGTCEKVVVEGDIVCDHGKKIEYYDSDWGSVRELLEGRM